MTAVSLALPMKLSISATVRTPPMADFLMLADPESRRSITSFSSFNASGWMPSRVATRRTTSLRSLSENWFRMSLA
jgi:hypothetical protein